MALRKTVGSSGKKSNNAKKSLDNVRNLRKIEISIKYFI